MVSIIDQSRCLDDRHALLQFVEKQHGKLHRSGRKEPDVEEFIRLGIDGIVQPTAFIIQPDHHLVDRNVTRRRVASRP